MTRKSGWRKNMVRIAVLSLGLIVVGIDVAQAQDIAGIEDCTKTSGLDKRTGCLQSNVNFLQRLVTKNALDAQNKLDELATEIVALKGIRGPVARAHIVAVPNIVGLLLTLAGVLFLFRYGMPYQVRIGGHRVRSVLGLDQDQIRLESRYDRLGWFGLICIALGTVCQIIASLV
jgi:hypothetical protein